MMDFGTIGLEMKRIDHFGIISGITRDLGICELIDEMIGLDTQEILTTGDVVFGMIINGLGFASRPLMLTPQFFENKALDILIKAGVKPNHFNRHRIGRAVQELITVEDGGIPLITKTISGNTSDTTILK